MGQVETHELLCILDFNNVRKRMSVIVKYEGKIRLFSKGADNVIFERLAAGQDAAKRRTQEHLDKFATDFSELPLLTEEYKIDDSVFVPTLILHA